ncbi:hypothetical protein D9757_000188 [Collybiopsis confluens]|uniref:DUF4187 domain-containing protein n=1 Tax=Collybiopsis confluens TaxID=2823264 RepID=A0A8H5MH51_9AGAR|nr:hypothetical protein D9757_000188 [Collybiopsis confluens]
MSDEEEDYLSNRFLLDSERAGASGKTYSQLRKDAVKRALIKNEQNRVKSRRERELEAREEGLGKSLFERAKEADEKGSGSGNKGLAMMLKMGFKPGESLGQPEDPSKSERSLSSLTDHASENRESQSKSKMAHRTEPLPLNEWFGKEGIGSSRKRTISPSAAERVAKMAKMADDSAKEDFRDRSKREYEERRAEGRLGPVQRTCATLDEKAGIPFNVLWLHPGNADTFPPGLVEILSLRTTLDIQLNQEQQHQDDDARVRLRKQMQSDALGPISESNNVETSVTGVSGAEYTQDTLEEIEQFLRLQARDRLALVLSYLRDRYCYCFWCGTQYEDPEDMLGHCPGPDEESHD